MRAPLLAAALAAVLSFASSARAARPFVTFRDDGYLSATREDDLDDAKILAKVIAHYKGKGLPLPEIVSVWTTFDVGGGPVATYFIPAAMDVLGIGIETTQKAAVFRDAEPPLRSVMIHNNVLAMPARAARYHMAVESVPRWLFMLEILHNWGASLRLPGPDPDALLGNPPRWSFWLDAGGSPAGGNLWRDNGDGTFTAPAARATTLRCSPLDLYVMGLIPPAEVPPFGVLEDAVPPADATDWRDGGKLSKKAFPWTEDRPLTVRARRRAVRIEDVIAKNGPRDPPFERAPKVWTLGIALLVGPKDTDAEIRAAEQVMEPIAAQLAPTFAASTGGRGRLELVTLPDAPEPRAALPREATAPPAARGCACALSDEDRRPTGLVAALALLAGTVRRRLRAASPSSASGRRSAPA
jgi:MYXO-CTERM domain-containing protein